mmetsp:Transcript_9160/g.26260  ORF Transcript_9160/g.26260 Transcript_9160/m.26260 type:complete len:97 (+) Transcript_9160:534-824(+)
MPENVRGLSYTASELRETSGAVPWKPVAVAVGLLLVGSVLLSVGLVQWLWYPAGHWLALTILGALAFLPGFYHTRIAFLAWRGYRGFSFSQLPNMV